MSKHLLDFKDIEKKDIEKLIDITGKLNPEKTDEISSISLLKFDEPSTRTRLSFSVAAYRLLSKKTDYPLHLGITESGSFVPGSVKSSIGLGVLLLEGIGDTLRVSLSDDPVKEIKVGNEILKSLNLRSRGVKIISCPSCARQGFDVIETVKKLLDTQRHHSSWFSHS